MMLRPADCTFLRSRSVLVAALALAGACQPVPEDEAAAEGDEQAATTTEVYGDREIDAGFGIRRPMRVWYGNKCAQYVWRQKSKGSSEQVRQCVRWERDDSVWASAKLYETAGTRDANAVFEAAASCGGECIAWDEEDSPNPHGPPIRVCTQTRSTCSRMPYVGCGVAAAGNVLKFYGVYKHTFELRHEIENFGFPFSSNIGTTPDGLARDLQNVLNRYADGNFTVRRKSYVDVRSEVHAAIRKGTPIIVLVNNGGHYVMVTGYENYSKYSVTDYFGRSRQEDESALGLGNIQGDVLGWAGGYLPYTVITIDRQPR